MGWGEGGLALGISLEPEPKRLRGATSGAAPKRTRPFRVNSAADCRYRAGLNLLDYVARYGKSSRFRGAAKAAPRTKPVSAVAAPFREPDPAQCRSLRSRLHDLSAEPSVCRYTWPAQVASLHRLDAFTFTRVVPTHGTMSPTLEPRDMRRRLQVLVARLHRDLTNE